MKTQVLSYSTEAEIQKTCQSIRNKLHFDAVLELYKAGVIDENGLRKGIATYVDLSKL